jgi:hypothetical protein
MGAKKTSPHPFNVSAVPTADPNTAAPTRELRHQRTPEGEWLAWWSDNTEAMKVEWQPRFGDTEGCGAAGAGAGADDDDDSPRTFTVSPRLEAAGASLSSAIGALLTLTLEQAIKDAELMDGALAMLPDGLADLLGGLADDPALMLEAKACALRSLHAAERRLRRHEGKPPGGEVELVSEARWDALAVARADLARAYHVLQVCECLRIQAHQPRPVVVRLKTASMKPSAPGVGQGGAGQDRAAQAAEPPSGININAPADLVDVLTRSAFSMSGPLLLRRIRKRGD